MKRMKKLMSALMALAMVASLGVTALAGENQNQNQNNDPAPVTAYANAKGNSTGTGSNEGPMENHPIKLVLPTVASGTYNMILDPHDLIARTSNKKYTGKTFVTNYDDSSKVNNRLFFNDATDHYDGKSASATVTNKSYDDVNLIVKVEVDPKTNTFDFVDAATALSDSAETAQMYLAVTDGTQTAAVAAPPADAEGTLGDPTATVTNAGAEEYLTGATFAWTADTTDELKASLNDGFDGVKIKPTVSLANDTDGKYHITVEGATAIVVDDTVTVDVTSGTDTLAVGIYNSDATLQVATLTLTFDGSKLQATGATGGASEVTLAKGVMSQPTSSATITTKIAGNSEAYTEDYDSTNGYNWAFDNTKTFATASFNLLGNINGVDAWDGQSASGNQIGIKVIWEVEAYTESAGNGNSGNTNAAPTATVTQTAAAGGTATVTYTLGSGTSAKAKVNRVIYTRSGTVSAATISDDNNGTLTITMPAALIYNGASDWKVEFTDADGSNAVTVDISPKAS
jgi:hypothetical protein